MKYRVYKDIYWKARITVMAFVITTMAFSQVGIGTSNPDASAALDITSNDKGLLPPRLTNAQRNSITPPIAVGLMIWCTDCGSDGELQVFNGDIWTNMGIAGIASSRVYQTMGSTFNGETANDQFGSSVALSAEGTRLAIGAHNTDAGYVRIYDWNGATWQQTGVDIDGEAAGDSSGYSIALSADGTRVAIGAPANNGAVGHVRLYDWNGSAWGQIGADIDGNVVESLSGFSVALSSDGLRVAIGAIGNNSYTGQVRIYDWNGSAWVQTGANINGEAADDWSGFSVALSADGMRVAIGAPNTDAGYVRIYDWNGSMWLQTGEDINGEATGDYSGYSVAISADGTRVGIGSPTNDDNGNTSGQVRIYDWNGLSWVQTGEDIEGEDEGDRSGTSISLSADGTRVAIGAPHNDNIGDYAGHVRIYDWNGWAWVQFGEDINGEAAGDSSGYSVSLSANGTRVAIGTEVVGKVKVVE